MKLSEKGRFAPPPTLKNKAAREVAETIASWPDVQARAHWFLGDEAVIDGADFYLGEDELGHIHLDAVAHIALPPAVGEALIASGLAARFPWGRGFVAFEIATKSDVPHALWLFELSQSRRAGAKPAELLARIEAASSRAAS